MAERVVLHIGTMKSGTTYLQDVLESGAAEQAGGWYVGGTFGAQTDGVRRLLKTGNAGSPVRWQRLVDEANERPGVAVFSQEFLSFVGRRRVEQVVTAFGGTPVDVVLTVRDQHGAIPAQWQSYTRNRGTDGWASYLDQLSRLRDPAAAEEKVVKSFRRAQSVPAMLRRWSSHDAVASTTVVVVPPSGSGPTELWHRFCDAAGLEPGDPEAAGRRSNESLGYASCEALTRVNRQLLDIRKGAYNRSRQRMLDALLPLRSDEERPTLPEAGAVLAATLNAEIHAAVARHGVRLVGHPEELPTAPRPGAPSDVPPPDPEHVRRALVAAWELYVTDEAVPTEDADLLAEHLGRRLASRLGR